MPGKIKILEHNLTGTMVVRVVNSESVPDDLPLEACAICAKTSISFSKSNAGLVLVDQTPAKGTYTRWCNVGEALRTLLEDDVLLVNPNKGFARIIYRRNSNSNTIFLTSCCNSKCIMCPQPPKADDDVEDEWLDKQLQCIPKDVDELCITGGEPSIKADRLIHVLRLIAQKNPNCHVHVLSNARLCKDCSFVKRIAECELNHLTFGVPIYAATPCVHNFVVQVNGAFDETVSGIYNLASFGIGIEIRVVLHKQTIPELKRLVDFIYNKFPFAIHVAFMGMEHMGFVKKNWDALWISPEDYQHELYEAVRFLNLRGVFCSIYNLPFCLVNPGLWPFLRDSISDYKVNFREECNLCSKRDQCGGLFNYQKNIMPIKPLSENLE